jgi:NAD(P)-dependent dehydrogenase (short-subunit alcohol dehydrogenase family)
MQWDGSTIADQRGRTVIVTGANTGIGFEAARVLAQHRAHVVLACRDPLKGRDAEQRIRAAHPDSSVQFMPLDLSSLASIREFADAIANRCHRLDLLINNAGVMMTPQGRTADGFELQFGTNFLGHFALTGGLIELIVTTPGSRIVTLSSVAHRKGKIAFDNLNAERGYNRMLAYAQSKLACLMFAYELQRRLQRARQMTLSVAAHPGATKSELGRHSLLLQFLDKFITQETVMGALPTLRAAVDPDARGGDYFGPDGFLSLGGYPVKEQSSARSHDAAVAERLWVESEKLTGVKFL